MIDISLPLQAGMVQYPGDPAFARRVTAEIGSGGSPCRLSSFSLSAHAGTHVDAPAHFLPDGARLDELPVDFFCGPARVVACREPILDAALIARLASRRGEFLLFRTHGGELWRSPGFRPDYTALDIGGARALVAAGARGVGVDYLSIGIPPEEAEVHRILLRAGLGIIEGLDLSAAAPGEYDLICLPLRLGGAEGAPARAVLVPSASSGICRK